MKQYIKNDYSKTEWSNIWRYDIEVVVWSNDYIKYEMMKIMKWKKENEEIYIIDILWWLRDMKRNIEEEYIVSIWNMTLSINI